MRYFIPDIAIIGSSFSVSSLVDGENTSIPDNILSVSTGGYYEAGDGGGAQYYKVDVEPTHGGKFQSGDGAWWSITGRSLNVLQFGAKGDGAVDGSGTDDTAAIQAALDYCPVVSFPGKFPVGAPIDNVSEGRIYRVSSLVVYNNTTVEGDGQYNSVIWQIEDSTDPLITIGVNIDPPFDISMGAPVFKNISLEGAPVDNNIGIFVPDGALFSMAISDNLRINNQYSYEQRATPYLVKTGSAGIYFEGGASTTAFVGFHRNLEIRRFEVGIKVGGIGCNEQFIHGWIIDCLDGFNLKDVSTWQIFASVESGVENANGIVFDGSISNVVWQGGRCELHQANPAMIEFANTLTSIDNSMVCFGVNINIADGGAWPGSKIRGGIGNMPTDGFMFNFSQLGVPIIAGGSNGPQTHVDKLVIGGTSLGNGTLLLGRNAGGATATFQNTDVGNLQINGGNNLELSGDGNVAAPMIKINSVGLGFNGTNPIAKPTVSGSAGGNTALSSLLSALNSLGLINNTVP